MTRKAKLYKSITEVRYNPAYGCKLPIYDYYENYRVTSLLRVVIRGWFYGFNPPPEIMTKTIIIYVVKI